MAVATESTTSTGNSLELLLTAEDIQPGATPSYQVCKTIYLYHPLGSKMADAPVKMAMSQEREITVPGAPDEVVEQFRAEWLRIKCDDHIANVGGLARVYGIASLALGTVGQDPGRPLDLKKLAKAQLYFNDLDPLNTAGSLVLDQDPNSSTFQKHNGFSVGGKAYHPSRCCVLMNEKPVYIAYTGSAFGFVGRSVYQRALFPLKTFVQSMITDDMVTQKAGLLIVKAQPVGSIIDRLMQGIAAIKREMLKGGRTGNVITISAGNNTVNAEEIETLNMQNVDGAGGWARTNVLKNIATAADMPAVLLENETLTEGFGEGTEDAKIIAGYIDTVRKWLAPLYDFLDPVVQRRAWNEDFYKIIQAKYPDDFGKVDYQTALYRWMDAFQAPWPNLLKEPESDAVETEKVKYESIVGVLEVMVPEVDPDNKAKLFQWAADNLNRNKIMFPVPLILDWQAIADYEPPTDDAENTQGGPGLKRPSPPAMHDSQGRALPARHDAWPLLDAAWNEADHPRATDGKFGSGGAGGASGAKSPSSKPAKRSYFSEKQLSGLKRSAEVRQPFSSWSDASAQAKEGRMQFAHTLTSLGLPEGSVKIAPNKSEARSIEKVEADYDGDWSMLKDVVRGTIIAEDEDELAEMLEKVFGADGLKLGAVPKDRFAHPTAEGYSDINTLVELPNGMVAELQFNTKAMLAAKEKGHALYEEQRSLQARNGDDEPGEGWSDADHKEFYALRQQQRDLYSAAREAS